MSAMAAPLILGDKLDLIGDGVGGMAPSSSNAFNRSRSIFRRSADLCGDTVITCIFGSGDRAEANKLRPAATMERGGDVGGGGTTASDVS